MTRWNGENSDSVYKRCGIGSHANGTNCGVVEWVKRNMLRRFGHVERMENEEFVKKVCVSENVGPSSRGRPPGRWKDRVKEYMCERCNQMSICWIFGKKNGTATSEVI